jgi:cell division protein FtsI (penicillin-binding protein 3)
MFTITVVIDSPHAMAAYGGVVAAPIFQRIATAALRHYGVAPTINAPPPLLVDRRRSIEALPIAQTGSLPVVVTSVSDRGVTAFPDLRGLGARDALRALSLLGITARLHGTGVVVRQQPEAGAALPTSVTSTLWLGRAPPLRASVDEQP